jgi:predicted esterase
MAEDPLERAIGLIQAGKIDAARGQLELIIKNDRSNIPAWHWYAQTWPAAREKARIWQACLRYNPTNEQVQQTLKNLNFDPQRQVPSETKARAVTFPTRRTGPSPWLLWIGMGLLAAVAIFAWMAVVNSAPKDPAAYRHVQPVEYYLYVPKAYSADKEWPLFVGIHGAGSNGLQCWQLWQAYAEKEGFILLCPTIPGTPDGFSVDVGESTVWSAIGEVKKEYRVKTRMFMSGFSAGAIFVQIFTYHYPSYVGALAILSSGNYLEPSMFAELIPMVVVIGGSDDPGAVQSCQSFVSGLQGYGFDVKYEVLPGVGHTVTQDGVNLTLELFRKTIGK